ncbi:hypothetical protein EMPS_00725 [Entomortierella parvispora]|uniref:Uncharacterized protein n=1 Tax=Entomortierella parvispora TaxID=205924 RepID=A0A9P3LS06_9FUNG|nr:hypothetical protein EMPS_00725 [Entomortierella parvispora]
MLADRRPAATREFKTQSSSSSAAASSPLILKRALGRSVLSSLLILHTFLFFLSPSSLHHGSLGVQAALQPGFCGDCQTFSNAISVCGGTFGPADIEISGEYVLQQQYQKCICTNIIRQVLWTCAKCEMLAGHASKAPPPTKYQTQCIAWGMTIDEWNQPYTGVVAPGTQTDMGQGPNLPDPVTSTKPPASSSDASKPSNTGSNGGNNGGNGDKTGPSTPDSSSDNSTQDGKEDGTGVNSTAIGISVGIIGVAAVAGIAAVVMMKRRRRRRRHLPLDLEPPAALRDYANGYGGGSTSASGHDDDKWGDGSERYHPSSPTRNAYASHGRSHSPTMNAAPVASANPVVVGGYDGYDVGYDGYDYQHQPYDRYAGAPPVAYEGYTAKNGHGDVYADAAGYGHHPQGGYPMQDFGYEQHYDQQQQQLQTPPVHRHPSGSKPGAF